MLWAADLDGRRLHRDPIRDDLRHLTLRGNDATQEVQEDEAEVVKALSREQLAALLDLAPVRHRLLIRLMASTGLRVSEAIGLQSSIWRSTAPAPT